MNQAAATGFNGSPKLRLLFDEGTILVEGLPEGDAQGLPGIQFDFRTRQFRARRSGIARSCSICSTIKIAYADEARAYDKVNWTIRVDKEAFPHQTEGLKAWWDAGRRGVVVLPTGTGKTHLANLAIAKAQRPDAGRHADDRPDEPVVRRADPELRHRGRPARRGLLRRPAADGDDLRLGLHEHGPARQPVRADRLRRVPPPARARPTASRPSAPSHRSGSA